jgi:hypothetical protein
MDLEVRHDRRDGIERRHDALRAIVIESDVVVGGCGVAPGHHEHREAAFDEIPHERIVWAQIEDAIFHDPGRHD